MTRALWTGVFVALAAGVSARGDDPSTKPAAPTPAPAPAPGVSVAARFAAVRDEYEAATTAAAKASEAGKTDYEQWKLYGQKMPNIADFSRRMVDLAAADPKDPGARDALLWVIDQPGMSAAGPYADEYLRAASLLLRYHADDPEVARVGLQIDNIGSLGRDLLLEGLVVRAAGRETKGLARMALAQYLMTKAKYAEGGRKALESGRPVSETFRVRTYDDSGKMAEREFPRPPEERAYELHTRALDPEAVKTQARRLFEEVIKDYGDVPYVTRRVKALQETLKQPRPEWNGRALTPEELKTLERRVARRQTLAEVAKAKLDELDNLVEGKPAPPIEGVGMDGKPLKLADYRGKVVVLVFWGTWCGPCMAEVPNERALAEKYKDRPFAILGIDCESDQDAARKVMAREKITWPNWNDGDPGDGPIVKAYHVKSYPSTFVLDGRGVIRHIHVTGSSLDKAVEALLREPAAK